jgi:arylsulfatase A-like enzyme
MGDLDNTLVIYIWGDNGVSMGVRGQHAVRVGQADRRSHLGGTGDAMVDGIAQEPMDGSSFAATFDDADAPEYHTVQYFESMGSRAIYKDGWWACARLDRVPWDFSQAGRPRREGAGAARRAQGALLDRSRAESRVAAARRHVDLLRDPSADAHPDQVHVQTSTEQVPTGKVTLKMLFETDEGRLDRTVPVAFSTRPHMPSRARCHACRRPWGSRLSPVTCPG